MCMVQNLDVAHILHCMVSVSCMVSVWYLYGICMVSVWYLYHVWYVYCIVWYLYHVSVSKKKKVVVFDVVFLVCLCMLSGDIELNPGPVKWPWSGSGHDPEP